MQKAETKIHSSKRYWRQNKETSHNSQSAKCITFQKKCDKSPVTRQYCLLQTTLFPVLLQGPHYKLIYVWKTLETDQGRFFLALSFLRLLSKCSQRSGPMQLPGWKGTLVVPIVFSSQRTLYGLEWEPWFLLSLLVPLLALLSERFLFYQGILFNFNRKRLRLSIQKSCLLII